MGRILLFIVFGAVAASGSLFLRSSAPTATATADRTYQASDEAVAREIAMTGLADAEAATLARLAQYEALVPPETWAGDYGGGAFGVEMAADSVYVTLTATGTYGDAAHRVRRAYHPRAGSVPPFMIPAMTAGNNLHLRDAVSITAPPPVNTNIHANGNIQLTGRPTLINGLASSGRHIQNRTGSPAGAILVPNANPTGLPLMTERGPAVPVPDVPTAPYAARADVTLPRGSDLGGVLRLGTKDDPVIVYAEAHLGTRAPVLVEGWGIVVVRQNFTVNHPITLVGGPEASQLAVVAGGNIHVNKPVTVAGNWFAGNSLHFDKDVVFERGTVTARNNIHFKGPVTMDYASMAPALAGLLWPDHMVPRSHREW